MQITVKSTSKSTYDLASEVANDPRHMFNYSQRITICIATAHQIIHGQNWIFFPSPISQCQYHLVYYHYDLLQQPAIVKQLRAEVCRVEVNHCVIRVPY